MLPLGIMVTVSLLILSTAGVDGCSCIKRHPQEHYCTADFGIYFNIKFF